MQHNLPLLLALLLALAVGAFACGGTEQDDALEEQDSAAYGVEVVIPPPAPTRDCDQEERDCQTNRGCTRTPNPNGGTTLTCPPGVLQICAFKRAACKVD